MGGLLCVPGGACSVGQGKHHAAVFAVPIPNCVLAREPQSFVRDSRAEISKYSQFFHLQDRRIYSISRKVFTAFSSSASKMFVSSIRRLM